MMNDSVKDYIIKQDSVEHTLKINTYADTVNKYTFKYRVVKPNILVLNGLWKKDWIEVKLIKRDMKSFTLLNRGFHFINEQVYAK